MIYYFDTSALLKKYLLEIGSKQVLDLFREDEKIAISSKITLLEGCHGITRKCREENVSASLYKKLLKQFQQEFKEFKIIELSSRVFQESQRLIQTYALKTLDSIHVASAFLLKQEGMHQVHFVSCDLEQLEVAKKNRLIPLNPMEF